MIEFPVLDEADQQFGAILGDRRVTIRLRYNGTTDRWSFDLSIDDLPVLRGRRIVLGADLLDAFDFGIGAIFAYPAVEGAIPDRAGLPAGRVKLYHATDEDIAAALEA